MRKMMPASIGVLILSALSLPGPAAVKPNALFCDNALLQRDIAVPVWGKADNGEKVTVTFQDQRISTTAKGGKWMVKLKPMKAGGPFTMTIEGSNKIELKNVMVGEVWICSGQSNMEFSLKGASNADEVIAQSADPLLREFRVPKKGTPDPLDDIDGSWLEAAPDTTPSFTAVGYFFGRELRRKLNVPVGLIKSSYGGTRIEAWTSRKYLGEDAKRIPPNQNPDKDPGDLYNAMIHPLIPYAIRGAIWYQGEANTHFNPGGYRDLLSNMIANWRNDWAQGAFPFLFAQLAPYVPPRDTSDKTWPLLRESQLVVSQTVPCTAMAVITDCGDANDIHPKNKQPVGERLALAARAIAYGEKIDYRGPVYKSVSFRGNRAALEFDCGSASLAAKGGELRGFTIAGPDKQFRAARASIHGNQVIVSSDRVANPWAVRYGWSNCPDVNLFDSTGLPASPFRTDGSSED